MKKKIISALILVFVLKICIAQTFSKVYPTGDVAYNVEETDEGSIEVRNEMIACVPYISDSAWTAAFNRNPAMNEWHISQVLLEASPLDKDVIQMMKDSGLDPYYQELVENGQNGGMTHKMILENDMATYKLAAAKAKNDYLRQRVLWDTTGTSLDSLDYFLSSVSTADENTLLASLEIQKGNYTQALSMLGTCQVGGVQDDLCMVQKTIAEAKQADQFCPAFSSLQMTELSNIASDEKSPGYAIARSLLRQHADSSWAIDIRIMPETKRTSFENKNSNSTPGFVKVHPNPASGEAFFTSKLPDGVTEAELVLTDSFGKIVWRSEITGNQIIPLNLSRFTSGVYVYSLYLDGIMTESHKLVISK